MPAEVPRKAACSITWRSAGRTCFRKGIRPFTCFDIISDPFTFWAPLRQYCGWAEWEAWGSCSSTCGQGDVIMNGVGRSQSKKLSSWTLELTRAYLRAKQLLKYYSKLFYLIARTCNIGYSAGLLVCSRCTLYSVYLINLHELRFTIACGSIHSHV